MAVHKSVSMKEFRASIRHMADNVEHDRKERLKKYGTASKHYQYIMGTGWAMRFGTEGSRNVRLATFKKYLEKHLAQALKDELGFAEQYGVDSQEAWREKGHVHGLVLLKNLVEFYEGGRA